MIGIMNAGSDSSVEFYATNRQCSLYARKPSKDSRTYTPEGRVFINGSPVFQETADDLWQGLIHRAMAKKIITRETESKPSGPLSALKRLSTKFRPASRQNSDASTVSEPSPASEEVNKHVTVIRIHSVENSHTLKKKPIHRGVLNDMAAASQSSILMRLMEEQAREDERAQPLTRRVSVPVNHTHHDSGRASLDDEFGSGEMVVVERF